MKGDLSTTSIALLAGSVLAAILLIFPAEPGLAEVNLNLPVTTTRNVPLREVVTVNGSLKPHVSRDPAFRNFTGQVKSPGDGGISEGESVTLKPGTSLVLYRAYSARWNNRLRNWWSPAFQYSGPFNLPSVITTTISTTKPDTPPISYASSPVITATMAEGEYRNAYAICKNWNDLDRMVICSTKPGATFLIGKTQSVSAGLCEGDWIGNRSVIIYPATDTLQIFIAADQIDPATCTDFSLHWKK